MLANFIERIPARYWGLLALLVWGGLSLLLLRHDLYGLDEGAARALLLNWSIVDNVANPIVIFGVPDFRALLFIPLGIYWSGSLTAAKVFTLLIMFIAGVVLYQWRERTAGREVALIATGLLLISPATLLQADAIGAGPYLLLMFSLGAWLDKSYRDVNRPLGGKYFSQLLLVAITVTLHPAGLAYPIALLWMWYKNPLDKRQQRHVFIGVLLAVAFVGLLRAGWHGLEWWSNPLISLTSAVLGPRLEPSADITTVTGGLIALLLLAVLILNRRALSKDIMGGMLVVGVLLGSVAADLTWAMLAIVLLLYYGISKLISANEAVGGTGFIGQRGGVMVIVVMVATLFMNIDKAYSGYVKSGIYAPQDQLIRTLALEAADSAKPFRAISQWPARTMIVVKRDVLPLPPPVKDGASLSRMTPGITHIMFDPYTPANKELARAISELSATMETLSLQTGGVIVKLRGPQAKP
ncbi:MAG: hypothetical protein ABIR48_06220 [Gammaproteobacteria bacterium]